MVKQKASEISISWEWLDDILDCTNNKENNLSSFDALVYLAMRCRAWDCGRPDVTEWVTGEVICVKSHGEKNMWVYESSGANISIKEIQKFVFNVSKNLISRYESKIKLSVAKLVGRGLIICYDEQKQCIYNADEFILYSDKWDYNNITYFFPVCGRFFLVPRIDLTNLIRYCKTRKEINVDYFLILYLAVRGNFSISKIAGRCFLSGSNATYFTSRRGLWKKIDLVMRESVGIYHDSRKEKNEFGFVTIQDFYESEEVWLSWKTGEINEGNKINPAGEHEEGFYTYDDKDYDDGQRTFVNENGLMKEQNGTAVVELLENPLGHPQQPRERTMENVEIKQKETKQKITTLEDEERIKNHPFVKQFKDDLQIMQAKKFVSGEDESYEKIITKPKIMDSWLEVKAKWQEFNSQK